MFRPILGALCALLFAAPAGAQTAGWYLARLSGLSTTVQAVKYSAGRLGMLQCYNPNATQVYIQVFNLAATSVTLGTTAPVGSFAIAPTQSGGFPQTEAGINVSGPISMAATTTATGNSAPSTAVDCNATYY